MSRRFIRKGDKTDRNGVVTDGIGNSSLQGLPMQLLAFHAALARGTDLDKQRNLATSVTVE